MIDIGINIGNKKFKEQRKNILANAREAGLDAIILTTTSEESFRQNMEIHREHRNEISLFTTIGLHPHNASEHKEFFSKFDEMYRSSPYLNNPIVAIGEFGLDYNRMFSPKNDQITSTELHFDKAQQLNLPCFLHERDAHEDFLHIMKKYPTVEKVVHCFTSHKEHMKNYLDTGAYIGITGWVTYDKRGQELQEAVKYLPLDRMMVETDSPYLAPKNMPKKTFNNEPAYLSFVIEKIAEIKGMDKQELANLLRSNTVNFFGLPMYH